MADQEAKDDAAKARIITHMNEDHHDSVIRYLQHFHHLSAWTAYDGRISNIDLNGFDLACGGKTYRTPFDPPMKSYREARERVVQLDAEARTALDQSDITVSEVTPWTGLDVFMYVLVLGTFTAYSQRWWFAADGPVATTLGDGFAKFSWTIQPWIFWGMASIHSAEMLYMMLAKLPKHSVNPRTSVYWRWAGTTFVEGVGAFKAFRELVERKAAEKAKLKH